MDERQRQERRRKEDKTNRNDLIQLIGIFPSLFLRFILHQRKYTQKIQIILLGQ